MSTDKVNQIQEIVDSFQGFATKLDSGKNLLQQCIKPEEFNALQGTFFKFQAQISKLPKTANNWTLDPNVCHPSLILSDDNLQVTNKVFEPNTQCVEKHPCILGTVGFNSGKHTWKVAYENLQNANNIGGMIGVIEKSKLSSDLSGDKAHTDNDNCHGVKFDSLTNGPVPRGGIYYPQTSYEMNVVLDCDIGTLTIFHKNGLVFLNEIGLSGKTWFPIFILNSLGQKMTIQTFN